MLKFNLSKFRWALTTAGLLFLLTIALPGSGFAQDSAGDLKQQLEQMSQEMQAIREKIKKIESENAQKKSEMSEMEQRMNKTELHSATDKVALGIELRSRADTLHYGNIRMAPGPVVNGFFTAPPMGFNGATAQQIQQGMADMTAAGMVPPPDKVDADNNLIFTNKFHLNMTAKLNENVSFGGRLAAYKAFGDSTGVKFNQGNLGDVTFDGNTSSLPHGDMIRLERAYFNYKKDMGEVPVNFSLGRRPSTEGPPLEYANYGLEGGSPLGSIINWQFDGASLSFGLEDPTGIPGAAFKLCYGVGFEGDWGNSSSLTGPSAHVDDVHMFGFIATLFDNDTTSLILNYAHAWDVTDGFTGLTVMPFIVSKNDADGDGTDEYFFDQNNGAFITRMEPSTNIGDWDAASLLVRSNLSEHVADIDLFLSTSWSHTDPSQVSKNPYYELMGTGLLSSNGNLEKRDGYSIYAGAVFPMPLEARLGFEYNWGSKYWFNFTGAEDSLVGSKLAVRGQVYEGYYIQPIYGNNFFVTIGGRYYDYDYTGSGNPLGEPVKISEATAFDTLNAVVDTVWDGYVAVTFRY